YTIVPEDRMRDSILQWVTDQVGSFPPPATVTIAFNCHGLENHGADPDNVPHGTLVLGWSVHRTFLPPSDLLDALNAFSPATQVNLILMSCFSGEWIKQSLATSTHQKLFIHASAQANQSAYPLRSVSNKYRCSLFASSVVEAIQQGPSQNVAINDHRVTAAMEAAFQHPNPPLSSPRPVASRQSCGHLQRTIGSILGLPSLHQYGLRALYESLMAWIAPQKSSFPYGASANEIHEIVRNPTNFRFSEAPVFSLMEKYSKGTMVP
ncbi:hypothetical protein FN846DRAFT_973992, partial [Sphaerosporella brunnea]